MPTPLNKIESNEVSEPQTSDEDRVKRIMADMNSGAEEPEQERVQETPGRQGPPQYEYQADQMPPGMMPPGMMPMGHPMMGRPMPQQMMQAPPQPQYQEPAAPEPPAPAKKNVFAHITDALKLPLVVALVFFLLSLPVVDLYLSRYAHWAFSSGGNLSIAGLAIKSLAAGLIMGVYDTLDKVISRLF